MIKKLKMFGSVLFSGTQKTPEIEIIAEKKKDAVNGLLADNFCAQNHIGNTAELTEKYKNLGINDYLIEQILKLHTLVETQKEIGLLSSNFDINIELLPDEVEPETENKLPTLTSLLFTEPLDGDNILRYMTTLFCADSLGDKRCTDIYLQVGLRSGGNILQKWYIIHNSLIKYLIEDNVENRKRLLLFIMNNVLLNFGANNPLENTKISFNTKRRILNGGVKDCKKMFNKHVTAVRINYLLGNKKIWKGYIGTSNNPLIKEGLNIGKSMDLMYEQLATMQKMYINNK